MRKIEPELITGMGYIGDNPGVLYRMGGAGEQTVVTGNPALLDGVKGSRFTSLTLHGKSTQGSTTGAQLFDFENAMQKIIGNWTSTNILSAKDTNDISVNWKHLEGTAQTYIAIVSPFKFDANKTIYLTKKIGSHFLIYDENGGSREDLTIQSYTPTESFNGYIGIGIDKGTKVDGSLIFSYDPNFLTSEPYTGGAPSPSPSYPQEIESAGQGEEIEVEVYGGNLLLCEEEEAVTLLKEYKFKNPLPVGEYRVSIKSANREPVDDLFLYAMNYADGNSFYGKVSFKTKNTIMRPTNAAVSFAIYSDTNYPESDGKTTIFTGLMLNAGSSVVPYEPYKPAQKLIIPTPGGLPGIPVTSGGNYTDKDGQQWVCDEIDLANGEKVQWVYHRHYASDELLYKDNMNFNIHTYKSEDVNIIDDTKHILVNVGRYNPAFAQNNNYRGVTGGLRGRVDDIKSENDIKNVFPNGIDVWFIRKTPIRTPLPPETIAAYKALHTYSPTTTVINDAGAGMIVGYKRK